VTAAIAALLGLLIGSFVNVVAYRVPRGESVVSPASRCPSCGHGIRNRHNVPVVGWLLLRGRCVDCGTRISPRYPLVELITAVVFAVVAARLVALGLGSAVPAYLYFAGAGIALALIDVDVHRLPNVIVLPSYPIVAVLLTASAWWQHDWWSLGRAAIGAGALLAFYTVLALIRPDAMGLGDVKLSGIIGAMLAYLSWSALIIGAFLGFLIGAVIGVALIAAGRSGRKTAVPFGPFMIGGALLAVFVAAHVAQLDPWSVAAG
jgi:leader peptidase (prepilin peptidase)/N-methyltransferase